MELKMMDKKSYRLLKKLYKASHFSYESVAKRTDHPNGNTSDPVTEYLVKNHLIALHSTGKISELGEVMHDGYEITIEGRAYVEQKRRDFLTFFLPYTITTLIALLSLVATIASNWKTILSWFQG